MQRLLVTLLLGACGGPATPPATPPPAHADPHPHDPGLVVAHRDHHFRDAEKWATHFDSPDRRAWQQPDQVVALMQLDRRDRVADLGAGTGYFLPYLSRAVPDGEVLALDTEPEMVEYMKRRIAREQLANVEARVVQPDDPGLADGSLNKILIVNTWHHVRDRAGYARKLHAALAACAMPPATVAIVDFTLASPIGPPPAHRLAPEAVVEELRAAGLAARIADESLPHQYVVLAQRTPPPAGCRTTP